MGQEDTYLLLTELTHYILLPALGFLAGFGAKWFLQKQKSRDELLEALASPRADALRELWAITTLRPEITSLKEGVAVPPALLEKANAEIMEWYTRKGGALFLSWQATDLVFRLLDALRNENIQRNHLERAVSVLRARLKLDCGIYSYWDVKRQLNRPRPSPWPADTMAQPAR
jgi:hypothetical protein